LVPWPKTPSFLCSSECSAMVTRTPLLRRRNALNYTKNDNDHSQLNTTLS
jgi:hypothetical protein